MAEKTYLFSVLYYGFYIEVFKQAVLLATGKTFRMSGLGCRIQ